MSGVTVAKYIIEAALFSAGKSISVEEISEATGLDRRTVRKAAKELIAEYSGKDSSLTVTQTTGGIALEVRAKYARYTMKLAEQEIPRMALKTLAIIAFHQPIKQSKLKMMIGSRAYEDVKTLKEMGLISVRPDGRSYRLETSSRFPDYFGIDPDPAEIKKHLADLVGVTLQEVPEGEDDEDGIEGAVEEESEVDGSETEGEVSEDTEAQEDAAPPDDVGTAAEGPGEPVDGESTEEPDEEPEEEPSEDGSGETAPETGEGSEVAEQVEELPAEEPEPGDVPEMDLDDDEADAKYGSDRVKEVQAALHDDGGI